MTDAEIDKAIANWHVLNKVLKDFTEDEVKRAIKRELVGNRRSTIVKRLHTRYCTLRQRREIVEMVASLDAPAFIASAPVIE